MSRIVAWAAAFLTVLSPAASSPTVTDLAGLKWTLESKSLNISVPGKVPSAVHLDLWAAGKINDPLYGLNDYDLRWVIKSNWTYSAPLDIKEFDGTSFLLFNGLDTYTSIDLCGKHIAATNNQFRQYYFDVTSVLKDCKADKTLSINFGDAASIAEGISKIPGQETWPSNVEGLFEFEHRQFVRKEQNDFGWDWGPAFVPAGVWQRAYLVQLAKSDVFVRNSLVDIYRKGQVPLLRPDQSQPWVMNASLDTIGTVAKDATLSYELFDMKNRVIDSGKLSDITRGSNIITGNTIIPAEKVELWWPVGMGNQTLYTLRVNMTSAAEPSMAASVVKKVGFRTILLNQEPIRQEQKDKGVAPGSNWNFEINGKEFYAKGSNFIPPDTFWTRVTKDRARQLFHSVVKGNQNMLRLWSSGAYLPDFMYDIADELGILLWSEFQFGDALYPVDKEFLDNVREEAHYQVRRLNHHPSLACWAGGNELENLELNMVRGSPDFPRYLSEYETLFLGVLGVAVFKNSRSMSYTPSSTSNGWMKLDFTKEQPITQRYDNETQGEIYGNRDHYNYNYEMAFDFSTYPVGRFSNEFGFHSMPSIQTWREAVDEKDLSFDSEVVRLRNHHYPPGGLDKNLGATDRGMEEMTGAAQLYYPVPHKKDPIANFTAQCLVTQIFQANFYSSQIQFYRRGSGMPERQLGSLYWQLEDIWQAPTWAGIEYGGRWKVLHYVAKNMYKNVIISPFYVPPSPFVRPGAVGEEMEEKSPLEIYITSDLWDPITANATFTWYDWSGKPLTTEAGKTITKQVPVGAINSTKAITWDIRSILKDIDPSNAILHMSVSAHGNLPNSPTPRTFHHENWFHPVALSKAKLQDPGLKVTHMPEARMFRIEATKAVAAWVWIDYPAGPVVTFEDNGFWLRPGAPREVEYEVSGDNTTGRWVDEIRVGSLWDMNVP